MGRTIAYFLIIDDITMNRTMLSRRVKKGIAPNATITEAATGEEALIICREKKFDVIIVDQHMEEAGGELLGTDTVFTMRRQGIQSIIIGCSGNDIDSEFIEAGSDWVMGKPTPSNSVILRQIKDIMKQRVPVKRPISNPSDSMKEEKRRKICSEGQTKAT